MKQSLLLIFLAFALSASLYAQDQPACMPDTTAPRSEPIYPIPHNDAGLFTDTTGINEPACLGEPFSFVLTVNTPERFEGTNLFFKNIALATEGAIKVVGENGIINQETPSLGDGLDYACNPPNCVFPVDTPGCIVIFGTPAGDEPDTLNLGIVAQLNFEPAGSQNFPFPNAAEPGNYFLEIKEAGECGDIISSTRDLSQDLSVSLFPNPAYGRAELQIDALSSGRYQLRIFNALGKQLSQRPLDVLQGQNTIPLDINNLPRGIYLVNISQGDRAMTRRLVISR